MLWGRCLGNPCGRQPAGARGKRLNELSQRRRWKYQWFADWNQRACGWKNLANAAKLRALPWGMLLMWCQRGEKETKASLARLCLGCWGGGGLTLLSSLRVCSAWCYVMLVEWSCAVHAAGVLHKHRPPSMGTSVLRTGLGGLWGTQSLD